MAALVCGAALLSGCSSGSGTPSATQVPTSSVLTAASATPSPSARALTATPYEKMLVADGAWAIWPLRDVVNGFKYGDHLADLRHPAAPAVDVDGAIDRTTGPRLMGTAMAASKFSAHGRLVTALQTGFTSGDAFTIELWFRADGCTNSWGRAAGTETADVRGREGVSMFFYPKAARQPCRLGVEIWHASRFVLGCPKGMVAPPGRWVHLATTYSAGTLSCYLNGTLTERHHRDGVVFVQTAPFGIGSAGAGVAGSLSSGSLTEVAVYRQALPAARLAAHAAAQA